MQDRNRVTVVQSCKQMWSPRSSAVCASAAWQTFSMRPARINHTALRFAQQNVGRMERSSNHEACCMCRLTYNATDGSSL